MHFRAVSGDTRLVHGTNRAWAEYSTIPEALPTRCVQVANHSWRSGVYRLIEAIGFKLRNQRHDWCSPQNCGLAEIPDIHRPTMVWRGAVRNATESGRRLGRATLRTGAAPVSSNVALVRDLPWGGRRDVLFSRRSCHRRGISAVADSGQMTLNGNRISLSQNPGRGSTAILCSRASCNNSMDNG